MRTPNRVEVASAAALFAAYPAFVVAEHHQLIGHQIYHYGTESVTVIVLTNLVWFGAINSPAANWACGRVGKAWHRAVTWRKPPLLPPPPRPGPARQPNAATHPESCQCDGKGVVPCPFKTADMET